MEKRRGGRREERGEEGRGRKEKGKGMVLGVLPE